MKLKKVEIFKYKSFEVTQTFELQDDITILVGMNESGKTSALEAIAKTNYFQKDKNFEYSLTFDYPRKEKKIVDKEGIDPTAICCTYEVDTDLIQKIETDFGKGILKSNLINVSTSYSNKQTWSVVKIDHKLFFSKKTTELGISSTTLNEKLEKVNTIEDLKNVISEYSDEKYTQGLSTLEKYFENKWKWKSDPLSEYISRVYLKPNLPKFLYYDEYFALPSRISIEKLESEELDDNQLKTAKALFELADINTDEILTAENFENFIAELEATESIISSELFKYWQTNKNLQIAFQIDKIEGTNNDGNKSIIEHVLDIRVRSKGVSLPLKNRSKGFNWFFSFLVWFKKIQEDTQSSYILLLDEPGLNLHASAQADLMKFLEDLSLKYQIIYTTHSPFMITSGKLERVRTVVESENGSLVSDSIQEKDPNTLFPLQAALGYDIAQNLFVSQKNLLVEGVSDLIFLTTMSGILEIEKREFLRSDVTIVPTGGLDKVSTFISLLRGSKLEIVCLLDSFNDPKGKAKMENLITGKIIHKNKIRFFDEFCDGFDKADLEDLYSKSDYLKLFNTSFPEYEDISIEQLNSKVNQIILQINQHLKIERYNHYRPANQLAKLAPNANYFEEETLSRFENLFKEINQLFN